MVFLKKEDPGYPCIDHIGQHGAFLPSTKERYKNFTERRVRYDPGSQLFSGQLTGNRQGKPGNEIGCEVSQDDRTDDFILVKNSLDKTLTHQFCPCDNIGAIGRPDGFNG